MMKVGCEDLLKKRFLINGAWLTGITLITRTIGIFFRVYMSNAIGSEAIGLYQLILTVYFFTVTTVTGGVSLVVTRLVTDAIAKGNKSAVQYITARCLAFSVGFSIIIGSLMAFFSQDIGVGILGDSRTVMSIQVLAPSLPFMAVSACLRGYFYARRKVFKTGSEQLIEQVVEIGVFALLVGTMAPMGMEYACCAVAIGTTAAEVVSFIYSYILYRLDVRTIKEKPKRIKGFLRKSVSIGVPVTLSSCLRSGLSLVENVMIPWGLKKSGNTYEKSLSAYGAITGMAMPVIGFPSVFLFSFSMLMIPEMSEANAQLHKKSVQYMTSRILRFALLFSLPTGVLFFFFAQALGSIIYGSEEIGLYIALLAPVVPLMYLDSVVDGILKGLNQQLHYLTYNIIDSVIRVILIAVLLPRIGIMGIIVVTYMSEIINTGLSLMRLLKVAEIHIKIVDWVVKPLISIIIPCLLIKVATGYIAVINLGVTTVLSILICVATYIIIMLLTGGLKDEEIMWFKGILRLKKK